MPGKGAQVRPVVHALIAAASLAVTLPGCLKPPTELVDEPQEGPLPPPATAAEVLERYIAAVGARERLDAIDSRTIEAQMVFHAQEDCDPDAGTCLAEDQKGSFLLQSTADGRLYRRTVLAEVVEEMGFDGTTGWELEAGTRLVIQNAEESETAREDAVLHWYFDLEKRGVQVTLERSRKEDSAGNVITLDGIRWEVPKTDAAPKTMWFSRETGLLHEEIVEDGEGPELQRQLLVYSDYRDVDGVQVPFSIQVTTQVGEAVQVLDIVTQRVDHSAIQETAFAVPKLEKPKPRPDTLLASLAAAKTAAEGAPKDIAAQTEYMRMAFAAANFDEAAVAANTVLALDAKEPEALLVLARIQLVIGKEKAVAKTLARAKAAGVKPEVLAREEAWVHYRTGEYGKLASALDRAKMPVLAGRFRTFVGKPVQVSAAGECVTTLPMLTHDPLATVEITVEGTKMPAIVDTGAGHLILSESLAGELGVSIRPLGAGATGPMMGHAQVKTLSLGDVVLENVPVEIFRDEDMARNAGDVGGGVRAAFGMGLFNRFMVGIDVPGKRVELVGGRRGCDKQLTARRSSKSVPFWRAELNYLYVKAKLDGAEGVYLLNTGIRGADMAATQVAYAHAGIGAPPFRSDETPAVTVEAVTIGDAFKAKGSNAAYGFFEQTQTNDGYRLDGMLGLGVLGQSPFAFDFEHNRLYFPQPAT
ncbi:MAG: retropepsin-like aspartic protease [Myxococcota bacterium]